MRIMFKPVLLIGAALTLGLAGLAIAIAFGGPGQPAPMASIGSPFRSVDLSGLPPPERFEARDGARLSYRVYAAAPRRGSVVLIHGSSSRGQDMHVLAGAFAAAGYTAYALDMRGHGDSGPRGQIAYVGQLDDDIEDFLAAVRPARPATLVGFSSGGGFALRIAAGNRQARFDNYLLLSPFLGASAPTYLPDAGGWVEVGLPRLLAIAMLNAVGVHAFDALPVLRFALNAQAQRLLTPSYSYALARNFGPPRDWRAAIAAAHRPMSVLAGRDDEVFQSERFAAIFAAGDSGKRTPVRLVDGVGHIGITLQPPAAQAAVAAVERMNGTATASKHFIGD